MKIRYVRNMDGALKMNADGYCWADCVLWQLGGMEHALRVRAKHPDVKGRELTMTMEDVGRPTKCGYCGNCMTDEEVEAYWRER